MHKITLFTLVLGLLTLTLTPLAVADYTIFNTHDTQTAWVVYSTWRPASNDFPAGFRTRGWYRVRPGETRTLSVPAGNSWVYLRITRPYPTEIRPGDHETRDNFLVWMHPNRAFTAVETADGTFLASDWDQDDLVQERFYEYANGGRFTISGPHQELTPSQIALLASKRKLDGATLIDSLVIDQDEMRQKTSGGQPVDGLFRYDGDNNHFILMRQYDNTCGTTSAEMLLHYYGKDVTQADIWEAGDIDTVDAGAWPGELRSALNGLGVTAKWYHKLTLAWLKYYVRQNRPPIILLRFGDFLHYVVVVGYNSNGDFLIADPNNLFRWLTGAEMLTGWSLDPPGLPNTRYRVEGRFQKFALSVLTDFTDTGLSDNNGIVPTSAPTRHFPPNRSEMTAVYVVGDDDWNPFFRTRYWERTLTFADDFTDYRVAALKPFLWEQPDAWLAKAYLQGHDDIAADEVKVWGQIEYGQVTRGRLWVIVRTYKHPKGQTVAAAPQVTLKPDLGAVDFLEPDAALPLETVLLGNYPNPFNPETWIPYHLATDAKVILTIYDTKGRVVRQLDLGSQPAGYYTNRHRAAYWDGHNKKGESVASGVYFYQLRAGEYSATKRMVIVK